MAQFPENFLWGVATASYQIEGAATEDGRGESIWDRFCATPGKVLNGDSGLVACDHYHRYREDVALMRELGVKAYRFSIAWPRILPDGRGQVNPAGLDFYDRLVDALLDAGIEPFVTLYHWDLPQALQDELGGWGSRETSYAFANYTDIVSRRLGNRVQKWITLNEPYVSTFMGHETGVMAPGLKDPRLAWQVSHHLLLGHGLAVPILRANSGPQARVGITLSLTPTYAATTSAEDQLAAQFVDGKMNRWFLDPVFKGSYPSDLLTLLGDMAPKTEAGDAGIIAAPLDFLGVNNYYRAIISQGPGGIPDGIKQIRPEGAEFTEMGWEVYPRGLYDLLTRLHQDYSIPQYFITENGAAFNDTVSEDGHVHDPRRVQYLHDYLLQAQAAIVDGVPLAGYFVWSLMDNFEWAFGYTKRFGIVYVDYPTQRRIIKDSGYGYRDTIAANGGNL
ncbi:MAG TPA: GH1 family beta-glucosidase [Ktedonobacteraceae bacterium]|nr:GH1 family beta-glucosidase [Ktedonobacteraceae bacterium]